MNSTWPASTSTAPARWRSSSASSSRRLLRGRARLRMTPSAVSKLMARLEARLGSRLVNRSTRKLQLTAEGQAFYERAVRILADMAEAEREAAAGAAPRGRLRVNSNVPFGSASDAAGAALPRKHPEITLDLVLTDRHRPDAGARRCRHPRRSAPRLAAGGAQARQQPHGRRRRAGLPRHPRHAESTGGSRQPPGVGWTFPRSIGGWPFKRGKGTEERCRRRWRAPAMARSPPPRARRRRPCAPRLFHIPHIEAGNLYRCFKISIQATAKTSTPFYLGHAHVARARTCVHRLRGEHVRASRPDAEACGGDGKWKLAGWRPMPENVSAAARSSVAERPI